jgi:hypothetical protein
MISRMIVLLDRYSACFLGVVFFLVYVLRSRLNLICNLHHSVDINMSHEICSDKNIRIHAFSEKYQDNDRKRGKWKIVSSSSSSHPFRGWKSDRRTPRSITRVWVSVVYEKSMKLQSSRGPISECKENIFPHRAVSIADCRRRTLKFYKVHSHGSFWAQIWRGSRMLRLILRKCNMFLAIIAYPRISMRVALLACPRQSFPISAFILNYATGVRIMVCPVMRLSRRMRAGYISRIRSRSLTTGRVWRVGARRQDARYSDNLISE